MLGSKSRRRPHRLLLPGTAWRPSSRPRVPGQTSDCAKLAFSQPLTILPRKLYQADLDLDASALAELVAMDAAG
jgi:hypothetical protein